MIVQESGRILELSETNPIIDYIHFHFVAKERSLDDLPKGGVIDISAAAQEAYAKYIIRITKKPLSDRCYDIYHVDTGHSLEVRKIIETMLKSPVPQEAKELEKNANDIAMKLISRMKRTGNPKSGVLFQIIYREKGIRKICFLKLAWVDESYFDYDEDKSSLTKRELLEKLPFSGRFQKGAIYPHPNMKSKAYMKVYQKDAEANYFESFLGGLPEISVRAIMKESKRLAMSVTGNPLSLEQNIGLFQGY